MKELKELAENQEIKESERMTEDTCTITEKEYEDFIDGYGDSPCSEYGACEFCPFSDKESD